MRAPILTYLASGLAGAALVATLAGAAATLVALPTP